MCKRWIEQGLRLACLAALTGCATQHEALMTHDARTMKDIWDHHTAPSSPLGRLDEARQQLRRPLDADQVQAQYAALANYTRTAQTEIQRQFLRLPNPDLVMFVFPHLAGDPAVPIPGYSTVFPFHPQVHYALPGEQTEDY